MSTTLIPAPAGLTATLEIAVSTRFGVYRKTTAVTCDVVGIEYRNLFESIAKNLVLLYKGKVFTVTDSGLRELFSVEYDALAAGLFDLDPSTEHYTMSVDIAGTVRA